MSDNPEIDYKRVALAAMEFDKKKRGLINKIGNGLSDRPKKGTKEAARKEFNELLTAMHELHLEIERSKNLRLIPSDSCSLAN